MIPLAHPVTAIVIKATPQTDGGIAPVGLVGTLDRLDNGIVTLSVCSNDNTHLGYFPFWHWIVTLPLDSVLLFQLA